MGQTGCPHDGKVDGKVVSTTHLHLGALAGYLGCSLRRLHTRPGAPWERHDGALGSACTPQQRCCGTRPWPAGPPALEAGTAGPQLASPATQAWSDSAGLEGNGAELFLANYMPWVLFLEARFKRLRAGAW